MAINTDRVLTSSASDYATACGAALSSFDLRGLHQEFYIPEVQVAKTIQEQFAAAVPDNVEAVVDFRPTSAKRRAGLLYMVSATALVPKQRQQP